MDYKPEKFSLGCNYWASNAGVNMWKEFDEAVIDKDLKLLKEHGCDTLRVFPLWSDFQPLFKTKGNGGDYRFENDEPLPFTEAGQAGVSEEMLQKFERFLLLTQKYGFKVMVSLCNGWMSGRRFIPNAFEYCGDLTDPEFTKWTIRYIRVMVKRFRHHQNIFAWEPGNETSVIGSNGSRFWVWSHNVCGEIRSLDPTRPIFCGSHGMKAFDGNRADEIGELFDVLTTHPYPYWTPLCFTDNITWFKTEMHSLAESCMYADLSGKPCIAEEVGTLSDMVCCDDVAGQYVRALFHSLWANGYNGFYWWCSADQKHLTYPPYDWCACERELGLFRSDYSAKPVALEMKKFAEEFLPNAPVLPERQRDAVCILSHDQNTWSTVYGSFMLAKQADIDLRFANCDKEIPYANVYMMPCLNGGVSVPLRTWKEVLRRVAEDGAVLYVSMNDALLASMEDIFGTKIMFNRQRRNHGVAITMNETGEVFNMTSPRALGMALTDSAKAIATEADGSAAFVVNNYGKGKIFFLPFALENYIAEVPSASRVAEGAEYYHIYQIVTEGAVDRRISGKTNPYVGITEHKIDENSYYVVFVNYEDALDDFKVDLKDGWVVDKVVYGTVNGTEGTLNVPMGDRTSTTIIIKKK
ncbi:MAG: hypothetical protein IIW23_01955 [Clostridia bacterium]|nr:hypothetical protein [Clostridia bacterium]